MNPLQARSVPLSTPRNLLLTLDAFGTIFYPRPSVPEQYAATAHEFGLSAVTAPKLKTAFKHVFRAQSKRYPNYGRADVLRGKYGGPRQWWEEVIRGSFAHVLSGPGHASKDFELPVGMVDALLDRFAGEGGYTLYDDVVPFFTRMRELRSSPSLARNFDRVVLGVISNSDDRVPAVLNALGLRVGDMRADQDLSSLQLPGFEQRIAHTDLGGWSDDDVDMVITSYEAGEEKPHQMIFDITRRQARLLANNAQTGSALTGGDGTGDWVCVHVGDDYEKDYRAAIDAGWQSYLLRGDGQQHTAKSIDSLVDLVDELKIG
ncbi:hypothetical protein N7448_010554 [Penicillium atrosanguineum]|uniref:Haloacid dehalogenase-like hydrolase n=1 Tax=Penicillium atrosanguineum TaxID=1132637 RepID=A0A9W9PP01_9EURO|nr:dextranase [Penicillium atrosanguineum]KAJ5118849.1 hypothetical protein N7526_010486 [Penicillium atrosanguineum]KAJ5119885.1 hypothetical protein N7448_010554 [Penicillium atrosanguineum]KAJ5296886.1 dextranase [Penicillium atrosanguineum]KAJ5299647.1 hypothetical protein N7476_011204 [Penicillium atrosanguineum]